MERVRISFLEELIIELSSEVNQVEKRENGNSELTACAKAQFETLAAIKLTG